MYNKMKEQEDFINLLLLSIKSLRVLTLLTVLGIPLSSMLAIVVVVTQCRTPFEPFQAKLIVVFDIVADIVVRVLALPAIAVPVVFVHVVAAPAAVVVMMMSASFVGCTKPG